MTRLALMTRLVAPRLEVQHYGFICRRGFSVNMSGNTGKVSKNARKPRKVMENPGCCGEIDRKPLQISGYMRYVKINKRSRRRVHMCGCRTIPGDGKNRVSGRGSWWHWWFTLPLAWTSRRKQASRPSLAPREAVAIFREHCLLLYAAKRAPTRVN